MIRVLCAYSPDWVCAFEAEAARISARFGDAVVAIHHFGSTAVPGLCAKPVIDILVEARSLDLIEQRASEMISAGYDARGEYGIPGRRYFSRSGEPAFHVHVYETGTDNVIRHLAFRDYLRAVPEAAAAYAALKRSLADAGGSLPLNYPDLKASFVRDTEQAALAWHRGRSG
jgi:GrpB-like predicted nucleotidyltransferase (UPF0157 family)